jgi:PAS domain S-box-containing protein
MAQQQSPVVPSSYAEIALRESEQRFHGIFDQAAAGIAEADPSGKFVLVNQTFCDLVGYTADELMALRMQDITHPDDLPRNLELFDRGVSQGAAYVIEKRYVRKDGTIVWVNNSVSTIRDPAGDPVRLCAVCIDVTDRKRFELALRQSEERYRSLVSASAQIVWTTNAAGEVVEDLPTWRAFTGQKPEQIRGFGWAEAIHPDDRERVAAVWQESLRSGRPHENAFRVRAADGTYRHLVARAVPVIGDDGQVREWVGTCTDVTARKLAEDAVRRSEIRFRTLFEQSPLSKQIYAPDGHVLECNAAWSRLFGVTMDDVRDYNILRDPELEKHGVSDIIRRAFAGEAGVVPPIPYRPDRGMYRGQERWCGATIYPVRDEHGAVREVVLIHDDYTDRKAAEEELQRAKEAAEAANRAKDHFLAVLSHELRTPLTPVLATVSALEEQDDLPRAVKADLEVIRRNVELETRLIDDLLDLTRITKGKLQLHLEPVDLRDVIGRVIEICREDIVEKDLLLMVDAPGRACYANGDPARLQQVLWNLVKNAVKFTPPGGKITVRCGCDDQRVHVEVADTGVGIDAASMPKLFEAFEQGRAGGARTFGGLGLGLAISRALTELHRGTLSVASGGSNRGSTFTISLPAGRPGPAARPEPRKPAPASADASADRAADRAANAPPPRILLVEDHPDTARIMLRLLRHHHYDVQWAGSIGSALKLAAEHPFDLVVSDLGLPDGSGLELMRQLRATYGLKGIALSGYGMEEDVRRSREAGFVEHLTKPVNFPALREKIEHVVRAIAEQTDDRPAAT